MDSEVQIDPALVTRVRDYGEFDSQGCYACGSCTVICPLTTHSGSFPRRPLRFAQIGAEKPLIGSLEPWLCYYCGECSTTCPQQTEPGESMMTLRRYLAGQYDWTGLTSKLYQSKIWQIAALFVAGIAVMILMAIFSPTYGLMKFGENLERALIATIAIAVLTPNVLRMFWFTVIRENLKVKIPLLLYITELKTLVLHGLFQLRFWECKQNARWLKHWFIMVGYLTTLILTVFFGWLNTAHEPIFHPLRLLGYLVIIVLTIFTVEAIIGRIRKKEQLHRFSQLSDWLFPLWLAFFIFALFVVHVFLTMGLETPAHYVYVFHLIALGQWALVIVPFGKWVHFLYRPLAIYFHAIKEKALQLQVSKEVVPATEAL